jgi:hypothetical protein
MKEETRQQRYYSRHREQILLKRKEYYSEHKEELLKGMKDYQKEHPNYSKEHSSEWRKEHPYYHRDYYRQLVEWAVNKLGKKCMVCGIEDCIAIYDFHHENGSDSWSKYQNNGSGKARTIKFKTLLRWKKEDKIPDDIKLWCSNCHRKYNWQLTN